MTSECTILSIEAAPGDTPTAVEQPNGDLLLPAALRPLVAQALLQAQQDLPDQKADLPALKEAMRLLGIQRPEPKQSWLANLYRVRAI